MKFYSRVLLGCLILAAIRFRPTTTSLIPTNSLIPIHNIHFVLAGSYYDYNLQYFHLWAKFTTAPILFIREGHDMIQKMITKEQRLIFDLLAPVPVAQADYMKFLSMYYLGGVVADFDVEPKSSYPDAWTTGQFRNCNFTMFVEHDCFDAKCVKSNKYARTAQLETWFFYSNVRHLKFLAKLLDEIGSRVKSLLSKKEIKSIRVQDLSGSGVVTDIFRDVFEIDYMDIPVRDSKTLTLKESTFSVAELTYKDETICIGGQYLGPSLAIHHYEGTWKDASFRLKLGFSTDPAKRANEKLFLKHFQAAHPGQ